MKKYLVIGLGSMGKRRVRCLLALGVNSENIIGCDTNEERRKEAAEAYKISTVSNANDLNPDDVQAVIVSLPPHLHYVGAEYAITNNKPVFIEASVVLEDARKIRDLNNGRVFVAPSNTFVHHPMIKKVREIVLSGKYGKVTNFSYHSGQYLPDWHPWENVKDFYVSNRLTGGAREIVPYELTWIVDMLGFPKQIKGYFRKTADVGCDIEDSYTAVLDYDDMIGTLLVDVTSRYVARDLILNMQNGQVRWRWDKEQVEFYDAIAGETFFYTQEDIIHQSGYGGHINENMYIEEIDSFLKGIENPDNYCNTLDKDIRVLELLGEIENSDGGF